MIGDWARRLAIIGLFGWLYASIYASVSRDLGSLGLVELPRWAVVVGFSLLGLFVALVVVDLRRTLMTVLAASFLGAAIYMAFLASPGAFVSAYRVQMVNYALIQSSLLLLLAGLLGLAGAMIGAVVNSVLRDIEL